MQILNRRVITPQIMISLCTYSQICSLDSFIDSCYFENGKGYFQQYCLP